MEAPETQAKLAEYKKEVIDFMFSKYRIHIDENDPLFGVIFGLEAAQARFYRAEVDALEGFAEKIQDMTEDYTYDAKAIAQAAVDGIKGTKEEISAGMDEGTNKLLAAISDAVAEHGRKLKEAAAVAADDKRAAYKALLASCGILAVTLLVVVLFVFFK